MTIKAMSRVVHEVRQAVLRREGEGARDAELLKQFVGHQDAAAFETLVQRHGALVMGVCRRVLSHVQDSEDAFQATFLVLMRKAGTIAAPDLLGNWLYGVAYHTALKAKSIGARRRAREKLVDSFPETAASASEPHDDLRPLLDHELSRLPEKYRLPILLCDLEGKTRREAATQLGWLEGTVSGRLSRARVLLAKRLTRRGVVLGAGGVASLLSEAAATAETPAALLVSITRAACQTATGQAGANALVSASVAELTQGVLKAMFLQKIKIAALSTSLFLLTGAAVMLLVPAAVADRNAAPRQNAEREKGREGRENVVLINGKVLEVGKDAKSIVLEAPPENRGDEPRRVTYKLDDKAEIAFHGVSAGGAAVTPGQIAQLQLKEGSTDTATKATFRVADPGLGRSMSGPVSEVSKDGKTFAIEIANGRDPNAEKKKFEFTIHPKTELKYLYVGKEGAKPTVGYLVEVWVNPGNRDGTELESLAKAQFTDRKRAAEMGVSGTLLAISNDGQRLTISTPTQDRRNEPAKKVEVKLAKDAIVTFFGVGPGGAAASEGMYVNAWLVDGTKDTAERVVFTKGGGRR